MSGSGNPFDGVGFSEFSAPELLDVDADGDVDAVVADLLAGVRFFENTGSSAAPVFTERSGSANRFAGVDVGIASKVGLADLDADGDLDALVGEPYGHVVFFRSSFAVFSDGFESGDVSGWSAAVP
ncbi:MAG: hypothetical protein HC897_12360 [Thermoanaerobaculia bacterium]|nr:hypothetical protein [Thermoanaerobaculia bacterium]